MTDLPTRRSRRLAEADRARAAEHEARTAAAEPPTVAIDLRAPAPVPEIVTGGGVTARRAAAPADRTTARG